MAKFDRVVITALPPKAEELLGRYDEYKLVSMVNFNNRLIFVLEKERGPGRPPKKENGEAK